MLFVSGRGKSMHNGSKKLLCEIVQGHTRLPAVSKLGGGDPRATATVWHNYGPSV